MIETKEEKMFISSVEDKIEESLNNYVMTCTDFLDLRQHSLVLEVLKNYRGISYEFYGGYPDAEREMCFFKPDYIDRPVAEYFAEDPESNPITWIRVSHAANLKPLSHRDYLGSLLGLGIRRETTGDILVGDNGANIAVKSDIAEFIDRNYLYVGRREIKTAILSIGDIEIPEKKTREISDTVASLRLDSIISSAFGMSRGKAAEAIRRGIVFVDGRQVEKADFQVKEGSKLVLRGKGKAVLREIGGKSRKDRQYILLERYI